MRRTNNDIRGFHNGFVRKARNPDPAGARRTVLVPRRGAVVASPIVSARRVATVCLIGLTCLLTLVSAVALWLRALVLNTDSYVRAIGPVLDHPQVRDALAETIVDALYSHVDVTSRLRDALPESAAEFAPTLAASIRSTSVQLASAALATPAVRSRVEGGEPRRARSARARARRKRRGGDDREEVRSRSTRRPRRRGAEGARQPRHPVVRQHPDRVPRPTLRALPIHRSHARSTSDACAGRSRNLASDRDRRRSGHGCDRLLDVPSAHDRVFGRRRGGGRWSVISVGVAVGRAYYLASVGAAYRTIAGAPFDALVGPLRAWSRLTFGVALGDARRSRARRIRDARRRKGGPVRA